jgi:hypothetical protein
LKLDAKFLFVMAGLNRWKACEQWQNPRFIPHPSTFLNQERWKDMPPAQESKGGIKVRESTQEEKLEAAQRARFFETLKANPGKSEDEIARLIGAV